MSCSGSSSSISSSVFRILRYVIPLFCMSLLQPSFPITSANYQKRGNETDLLALLAFKKMIKSDPLGVLSSWNGSNHFCSWQGVTCGRRHQRVTVIDLRSQLLEGSISRHIGNLSFLKVLRLDNNSFGHEIPPQLSHLKRLQILRLDNNSITGEIPTNISACFNLITLDFSYNKLVGKIPSELGAMSKLKAILIQGNNMTGIIPHSLGNLSSLYTFTASKNNLVGNIPDSLCRLTNLLFIVLMQNMLSGSIPSSLYNHSSIRAIDVGVNQIEGTLPPDIGISLPNIQFLSIFDNEFLGPFPPSISNATNLEFLYLGRNGLTGRVPNLGNLHRLQRFTLAFNLFGTGEADDLNFLYSLVNATNLDLLQLNQNNFGGALPESVGNLSTRLAEMWLSYNHISGNIPAGISNLISLEVLYMAMNQFTGSIPPDIGKLQRLRGLALQGNNLSGNIPSSIGNFSFLTRMSLSENNLHGSIPSSLGQCRYLQLLDLGKNNLSGAIPKEIFGLSSLSIALDLSHNYLIGPIPIEVGNLKNLGVMDLSENNLSGKIPDTIGSCILLETLYLQGNYFQGNIPSSFTFLRGIQFLDISQNKLSGKIPEFLEHFKLLEQLNISFNDFEGAVPTGGIFKNASATSVNGNHKLCGGVPQFHLPFCNLKGPRRKRLPLSWLLVITLTSGLLGITSLLVSLYFFSTRKRKRHTPNSLEMSILKVSYQSLLKATDGFSSDNLIGVGSFGSVYRGVLDPDGTIVAVKLLNLLRHGASKSFFAECEAMRNIRHRNLVKVLTACSGVDYQGNDFKALIYEFMENGSLEAWLHPSTLEDNNYEEHRKLDFLQRLNIAIDVASALDYLHHHCQTPIVHCDLKPSNVLLDKEMTGHVGDFGLARLDPQAISTLSMNETNSIGLRGSFGYTAPEYGLGNEVSACGDIYSFGIILLEMFTGKRPTDGLFRDGLSLHNHVKSALPDRVAVIADPTILQEVEGPQESTSNETYRSNSRYRNLQECLVSFVRIGVSCSAELPRDRMKIQDVVAELHSLRNVLRTGIYSERRRL